MVPLFSEEQLADLSAASERLETACDQLSEQFVAADKALSPILTRIGLTTKGGLPARRVAETDRELVRLEVREFTEGFKVALGWYDAVLDDEGEPVREPGPLGEEFTVFRSEPSQTRTLTQLSRDWRIRIAANGDLDSYLGRLIEAVRESAEKVDSTTKALSQN